MAYHYIKSYNAKVSDNKLEDLTRFKYEDGSFNILDNDQLKDQIVKMSIEQFNKLKDTVRYKDTQIYITKFFEVCDSDYIKKDYLYSYVEGNFRLDKFGFYLIDGINNVPLDQDIVIKNNKDIYANLERLNPKERYTLLLDIAITLKNLTYKDAIKPIIKDKLHIKFIIEHKDKIHGKIRWHGYAKNKINNQIISGCFYTLNDNDIFTNWDAIYLKCKLNMEAD